ncbi:MAG: hypothetical protein LKM31_15375 [Sphingobium sp.]|jgi:hypothetical protein|nr:hypothetical protein [Sphingobium sp.]
MAMVALQQRDQRLFLPLRFSCQTPSAIITATPHRAPASSGAGASARRGHAGGQSRQLLEHAFGS